MSISASVVANHFLELAWAENKQLTHMQLQKLVYFAHGVMLAHIGEPLINEGVSAWKFGPVIPELYDKLKEYGSRNITDKISPVDMDGLTDDHKDCINFIWSNFKKYSAIQLTDISNADGSPWHQVRVDKRYFIDIPNELTKSYYIKMLKKKSED